jgi:hypothetical protein
MILLLACAGDPTTDDTAVVIDNVIAVATTAADYSAGQLALVDWESGAVRDAVLPTASDVNVTMDAGRLFVLERSVENTVRMYDPADLSAPIVEISTGDSTNPQSAALCGETIVTSLFATDYLALFDATTGLPSGTVDLSAYDDGDGSPEAFSIVRAGDQLLVALNQLDTGTATWNSADGTGTIVQLDCASLSVVDAWETGPNPSLSSWPQDDTKFLLQTGDYFNDDFSIRLDGALYSFSPEAGISAPIFTEEAVGANLGAIAGAGDHVMLVTNDGHAWSAWCADLGTGVLSETEAVDAFINDAVSAPDGTAWLAYRAGYAGNGAPVREGLYPWNAETCTMGEPATTLFPPSALAIE